MQRLKLLNHARWSLHPENVFRSGPSTSFRRHASRYQSAPRRFISTTLLLGGSVALVAYYYDSRSLLHEHVVMPVMRLFDPETGHRMAVNLLSAPKWARPRDRGYDGPELKTELLGMEVINPVGIAAGFDKDGRAIDGLFDLGFGYVEIGSVTPEPQPGNPQPRFFRLEEDGAAINRYGFNSLGHGQTLAQLRARIVKHARQNPDLYPTSASIPLPPASLPRSLRPGQILAVNLGKNKTSVADSNEDYVKGVRTLGPYADIVVVNVSSPNTPGLRALQGRQILERLLKDVVQEREKIKDERGLPKIAVKVACDLSEDELGDVAAAVRSSGVETVVVSNTTIKRGGLGLQSENQEETGGLSGRPLFSLALQAVKTIRPLLPPSIPVIGCGGISTGSDALSMARAGASMVQVYTSFGYRGVGTPRLLKDELSRDLKGQSWKQQVGADWKGKAMGWGESRLRRDSEALKKEAEGLAEMLRKMNEDDDTSRLVREAEAALGHSQKQEESKPEPAPQESATTSTPANAAVEAPEMIQRLEGVPLFVAANGRLDVTPPENLLIEVTEEREDPWRQSVQDGDRRLV